MYTVYHIVKTRSSADTDKPNPRDAFRGQSRSPNIVVSFHILGILSSCALVTFTLRLAVFLLFNVKNVTLKSGSEVTQGY